MQSKAIRILAEAVWCEHAPPGPPLYVKLNIPSLDKLILYALAKFMYEYYLKCLPRSFNNYSFQSFLFTPAIPEMLPNLINTLFRSFPLHYCYVLLNLEVPNFGTVFPKILKNLVTNSSF